MITLCSVSCTPTLIFIRASSTQLHQTFLWKRLLVMFLPIARTAGWVSHWLEQQVDPEMKISRPRQIYTGHRERDYKDAR